MSVSGEEQPPVIDDTALNNYIDSAFRPNENATPQHIAKISKIRDMVGKKEIYEKYYVPKVVSIGPYHHGKYNLESLEKLKPGFTMKLLKGNEETRRYLYRKLGAPQMVRELRTYYEENSTTMYSDMEFTKMMLLDACFILYCMQTILVGKYEVLKNDQIFYIHHDLFLMENQIPYKVLTVVMESVSGCSAKIIKEIIYGCILASGKPKGLKWLKFPRRRFESEWLNLLIQEELTNYTPNHLLDLLHNRLAKTFEVPEPSDTTSSPKAVRCNFRNVCELAEVGIHFKPSNISSSSPHIKFSKGWWGCSAHVALPPITVNDSTKPILLNIMAYEACLYYVDFTWVTSYVCLLNSLIDNAEDVKVLRKAWVLENSLSSDKEVAELFNEIGKDLVPNRIAYLEAKKKIQMHYESRRITLCSQLKNEYFKSPWSVFAFLGALIALFFSGVQTYFTVWNPEGACDDLCMFLKRNHHL